MTGMSLNRDVPAAFMHNFIENRRNIIKIAFCACFVKINSYDF